MIIKALLLILLVVYCQSYCSKEYVKIRNKKCHYKNIKIDVDVDDRKLINCKYCSCNSEGYVRCCSAFPHYVDIPPHCRIINLGCVEFMVLRKDPSKDCNPEVISGVGR